MNFGRECTVISFGILAAKTQLESRVTTFGTYFCSKCFRRGRKKGFFSKAQAQATTAYKLDSKTLATL